MVLEGFLHAPGGGGANALVDRECLPQRLGGLAGVAVLQVGFAESFQGSCFLQGRAELAGNGQRVGVTFTGLASGCGPQGELAEAVQRLGLAEPVAEVLEQFEGLLVTGGGGRVVPRLLLDESQVVRA